MASSSIQSSSSALVIRKFDVFVSFRGKDTRNNFTDHLFGALRRKSILAFRDDTKLKKGESIAPELISAIEGSQVFVVVFSKNYASSTWCLMELEKVLECVRVLGKHVLPVFCDVDPSEVRYQNGSYAEAFATHEERFKQDLEMVQRWRAALTHVASLSGWDLRDKPQYAEIEKIVEEIINILRYKCSSLPNDLVGMHSPIEEVEKLLLLDSVDDVRVVGICGMGGLGKTTLATVLYNRISHQFDACCFIDDVSKIYRRDGPIDAQKQILRQTLSEEDLQISNLYNATNLMQSRLHRVRALIILDNVDQAEQLEKLVVNREWLGAGSRIIIISRDEHILKEYGVDKVYKIPLLSQANSLQLLCRKAFKQNNIMSDYELLVYDVLHYAKGLPLAIKVLGSFLFGRDITEWRGALARLRESPNKNIMDVLRLSFDGLEEIEKEIFLDIACFFNEKHEQYVKNILECCGFHSDIGLRVLIDKSLISISHWNMIEMHDLLQELGKKIVHEDSTKNPRKWSRLWLHENFYNVMSENMEKNVEAIVFNDEEVGSYEYLGEMWSDEDLEEMWCDEDIEERETMWCGETLSKMSHLRLLILHKVFVSGSLSCLSNKLRYVDWFQYPFKYFPSSFQPNQLVELRLQCSRIKQLWKGKKCLPNLKTLDLSNSENLVKMLDFGEVPNLEELSLEGCVKLVQLDSSIGVLRKLVFLNLKDCKNLSIPNNIFGVSSLEYLNLSGCSKVFNNPNLWSAFKRMIMLPFHSLYHTAHKDLAIASYWQPSLPNFSCLRELDVSFCGLKQIPEAIGCIHWLEKLNLGGNKFETLPSLRELSKLLYLNLQHCNLLKSLPVLPSPSTVEKYHLNHWWRPGLYIFNCPNLCEWERCSNMAFSWMIQFIQVNQQSSASFECIDIVIPGSEIPRWFSNQSVGKSIRIDPSPIMHDNTFIGVAFCVVLSVAYGSGNIWKPRKPELVIYFVENTGRVLASIPVIIKQDLITVKSNHIWLIYFPRESLCDILSGIVKTPRGLNDLRVDIWCWENEDLQEVEAMNCGYHWVFKEDLQTGRRDFLVIEDQAQPQEE